MTAFRAVHCRIEGRVQGVGFRYSAQRTAQVHNVSGWVRNRADGSVETFISGAAEDVASVIQWLHEGPRFASVTSVTCSEADYDPTVTGFEVRF